MQNHARYTLQLSQERIERDIQHAADSRLAARSQASIRRTVGHRIIEIGARLAAEPSFKSARSR